MSNLQISDLTHFSSLARIVEEFGVIDATSGGSSAAITQFLYQSMLMNPGVKEASKEKKAERVALLLKSAMGVVQYLSKTPEASAILDLVQFQKKLRHAGMDDLKWDDDSLRVLSEMERILKNPNLAKLINPAIVALAVGPVPEGYTQDLKFRKTQIQKAVQSVAAFKATEPEVFLREGLIHLPYAIELIGYIADFYAGGKYSKVNQKDFEKFLNHCTKKNSTWFEVADLPLEKTQCGDYFDGLLKQFYSKRGNKPSIRLGESLQGETSTLVSTSVVTSPTAINKFKKILASYRANQPYQFDFSFSEIQFGYWVPESLREKFVPKLKKLYPGDKKSEKAVVIHGENTWREALLTSPAEPGLSKAVFFNDNKLLSVGGWSDLAPVQVLKTLGCKNVIYITRRTPEGKTYDESDFTIQERPLVGTDGKPRVRQGIAELWGISEKERQALYVLNNPESSFSTAIQDSAVWCTDWNSLTKEDLIGMSTMPYKATLFPNSHLDFVRSNYEPKAGPAIHVRGCSFVP
jgi:hypothetical protein